MKIELVLFRESSTAACVDKIQHLSLLNGEKKWFVKPFYICDIEKMILKLGYHTGISIKTFLTMLSPSLLVKDADVTAG